MPISALWCLLLGRLTGSLPDSVDLRKAFGEYGLTVCNQAGPLCWDYTVVGLAEYELAMQRREGMRLSPGFLAWGASSTDSQSSAGSNFGRAYRALETFGLAPLSLGGNPDSSGNGATPDDATLRTAAGLGRFDIRWIRFWNNRDELSADELKAIESEIADGHPVAVGLRWPNRTAFSRESPFMLKVPPRDQVFDGHCVALVGYKLDPSLPGGGAFLFRNSWGENWADHGYAWMPFELLSFCINDALSLRIGKPLKPADSEALTFQAAKLTPRGVSGTPPRAQDMRQYGPTWGENPQLFFPANHVGERFSVEFPLKKAGTYELRLVITRAQDYGTFKVEIPGTDGPSAPTEIDGAGPGVSRSNPILCGRYRLKAGTNRVSFTVTGKGPASSGMSLGIDSIQLVPVGDS